jgi:quinol monooxygenase YgiN
MPVRLVITTYAKPGKGAELAQAMAERCRAVQQEPGCQQFEVFQRLSGNLAATSCLYQAASSR